MVDINKNVQLPRRVISKARAQTPAASIEKGSVIPKGSPLLMNKSIRDLRTSGQVIEAIRKLAQADGTVSTAVYSYVQVAMSGYSVTAYNTQDQQFSPEGTLLARGILSAFDTLYNYNKGYADKQTLASLVETALREVVVTGTLAGELVLDAARLPDRINIVPAETLKWVSNGDGTKYPAQEGSDNDINLNIPTFWVADSHKDASKTYAISMMEASINNAFYYTEFIEDMRRVMRRHGHSRMHVKLNAEAITQMAGQDVQRDPVKMKAFMEGVRSDVETIINSMEPDDALVTYDSVDAEMLTAENVKADYTDLITAVSGILATSLKSHPSILGLRIGGSQSLSNTESLIFLKNAKAIQRPVEDVLSRAVTLACRLYGMDVFAKFKFKPINIRPENELEAFTSMKEQRVLNRLSLGFITDDQAALEMGVWPLPPGYVKLSGTRFMNPVSTNRADEASPNADPQGRALQPDTPSSAGGKDQ